MFIVHENETYFVFKNCKQKQNVYINQQYELRDIQPTMYVKEWFMGDKLRYKFHMTYTLNSCHN